jgi:hypothetical protein
MTTKVVQKFKNFGLLALFVLSIISCEKEIESIGVNLIDNKVFDKDVLVTEVTSENVNVERVPSNGISQYLLGVYSDNEFGTLKASIAAQLLLPSTGEAYVNGYGINTTIDSVLVNIPYQSTAEDDYSDGKPKFSIDSVFGNSETAFKLSVYELKTFLNTLDPNDPSKTAVYYSDKVFQKGDIPLFSEDFKVNPDDTVAYIKRYELDGKTVYKTDTIKETDKKPSIKIPLNKAIIKQLFVDNASGSEFSTIDNFNHYFRGLYFEAETSSNNNAHLVSLSMVNAKMTIYYSKTVDETSDQDLDGDGTKGETGVRTNHNYTFSFTSLKSNSLNRDYTNSKQSGPDRLYVQGAAGSLATIDLFVGQNLSELQNKNWLINDARLTFYVDQNASSNIAPERLMIYNYQENTQITDMATEGSAVVGGLLENDDDGKPYKYVFKITDYISELLKADEPLDLVKLGIKVYNNPTDAVTSVTDLTIKEYSWTPKGVVLYNQNASAGDKRVKLEISYTELNK